VAAFAKALEVIPRQLADNAGLDSVDILIKLRQQHHNGSKWAGVDIHNKAREPKLRGTLNSYEDFIWEPQLVRKNALIAAVEVPITLIPPHPFRPPARSSLSTRPSRIQRQSRTKSKDNISKRPMRWAVGEVKWGSQRI